MNGRRHNALADESGQTLLAVAFCLVLLMGVAGLAVDIGMLFRSKVNLQKVADAAAIAGAAELNSGHWEAAARNSAQMNGVTDGQGGAVVTPVVGTTYHPQAVRVYVSKPERTYFATLFGFSSFTVGASAAAGLTGGDACIYALARAPFRGEGITMNGTGNLCLGTSSANGCTPTCGIYDNADLVKDGNSGNITATWIGVVGTASGTGISPNPVTGIVPMPDPLAYWSSPAGIYTTCAADPKASTGPVAPGCYNGLTVSGSATLNGLYIVRGNLSVTGISNPSTNGVTFYIDGAHGGSLGSFDGSNFSAPATGTSGTCTSAGCNGMLLWDTEAKSCNDAQQGIPFGPGNSTLSGILYFPNASLKFHGNNTTTLNADVVACSYVFDGTVRLGNYALGADQDPIFISPAIVE